MTRLVESIRAVKDWFSRKRRKLNRAQVEPGRRRIAAMGWSRPRSAPNPDKRPAEFAALIRDQTAKLYELGKLVKIKAD
jgi:CelD/BcsL family acetyltransferase involved in cellulose biosynthesis